MTQTARDLYEIGELPPVGEVPGRMHAQLVRPDRYGEPEDAIRDEVIDVPEIGPHEALVMVMASGVNFNNVWAARGVPIDVTKTQARWGEPTDFHIVGSDAAGIVWAVGDEVSNVRVGDHVVVHAGQWDLDDPWVITRERNMVRLLSAEERLRSLDRAARRSEDLCSGVMQDGSRLPCVLGPFCDREGLKCDKSEDCDRPPSAGERVEGAGRTCTALAQRPTSERGP